MLLHAIICCCMLLYVAACYYMLLHAIICCCMLLYVAACYYASTDDMKTCEMFDSFHNQIVRNNNNIVMLGGDFIFPG